MIGGLSTAMPSPAIVNRVQSGNGRHEYCRFYRGTAEVPGHVAWLPDRGFGVFLRTRRARGGRSIHQDSLRDAVSGHDHLLAGRWPLRRHSGGRRGWPDRVVSLAAAEGDFQAGVADRTAQYRSLRPDLDNPAALDARPQSNAPCAGERARPFGRTVSRAAASHRQQPAEYFRDVAAEPRRDRTRSRRGPRGHRYRASAV